ncbi:MAG: OmpH family outer membrane protein [Candidatus Melainabacteria bacterium]|nr:OmpH family outer membrane protein [Candidatus Melainabacteria bacterium]
MQRIIIVLILLVFSFWPALAQNASKIGVVDGEKVFDLYPGVEQAQKKISDAQDDLRNAITESENVYTEFEKQKKSEAEKLTKKKELQAKIDAKAQETKKLIESISLKIEDDIVQAIKKVAGEKGLEIVFDKRAVLNGGTDVTDAVSEQLKKRIPLANENNLKEKKTN